MSSVTVFVVVFATMIALFNNVMWNDDDEKGNAAEPSSTWATGQDSRSG